VIPAGLVIPAGVVLPAGLVVPAGKVLDGVLEASVVGSFSSIGLSVRSRLLPEFAAGQQPRPGRVAVVTGATSGLGLATAVELARQGMSVHFLARDRAKAARARRLIEAASRDGGAVTFGLADLAELDSVRGFAADFLASHGSLDVLIHNAGALSEQYRASKAGIELTVAGQVLAPFLLTQLLLPALTAAAPSRVITVSSGGMYAQRLDPGTLVMPADTYNGVTAYARAKRAQVLLSREWARRLAGTGVAFHSMHPGWASTPGVISSLPRFHQLMKPILRSPEQGADTIVWLATAPAAQLGSGRFWHDRRPRSEYWFPWTREASGTAGQLWEWAAEQTVS